MHKIRKNKIKSKLILIFLIKNEIILLSNFQNNETLRKFIKSQIRNFFILNDFKSTIGNKDDSNFLLNSYSFTRF